MFCSKCGKEVQKGAAFCRNCGRPVGGAIQPTAATKKKKSPLPWIIAGIVVIAAVILVVAGLVVFGNPERRYEIQMSLAERYLDQLNYEKAIAAYRSAIEMDRNNPEAYLALADVYMRQDDKESVLEVLEEAYDRTESSKVERQMEKIQDLADNLSERKENGSEEKADAAAIGTAEAPGDTDTRNKDDRLLEYYENDIIDQFGRFDYAGEYSLSYYESRHDGYVSPSYRSFDDDVKGILNYRIADFDGDNDPELLVCRIQDSSIILEVYECRSEGMIVKSTDYVAAYIGSEKNLNDDREICGDVQICDIRTKRNDHGVSIGIYDCGYGGMFADGTINELIILHYSNNGFITDFDESFAGSAVDPEEETEEAECRSRLRDLGYINTAESFEFLDMELRDEEDMEGLFFVRGENPYVYQQYTERHNYYVTEDVSSLGKIRYLFSESGTYTHQDFEQRFPDDYSKYILPDSNSRFLTRQDLYGFTAEECRLARNELFARYGRRFQDETLQAYFDSCSWYNGTIDPEDFDESTFNEYEKANRDLIVEYEKDMGYR